jgi:hypothetical protein
MGDVADEESGVEVKKTLCRPSPGCHCNCGLPAPVKDNKILSGVPLQSRLSLRRAVDFFYLGMI